jgi:hypothetical protein
MGRGIYIPEDEDLWLEYFLTQAGQVGHGNLGGFQGIPYQRGHGLGSFFARLFRTILPVVKRVGKSALKTVGKEALAMGANVAGDMVRGRDFGQAMEEHGRESAGRLIDQASTAVRKSKGQSGGSIGYRPVGCSTSSVYCKKRKRKATRKVQKKKQKIDYWD